MLINKLDFTSILFRTLNMMRGCRTRTQLAVAHRYGDLFLAHMKDKGAGKEMIEECRYRIKVVYKSEVSRFE